MFPNISLFGRVLPSYGVVSVIGFILGILLVIILSKHYGINVYDSVEIFTFGGIGAVVGAKILYIIVSFPEIVSNIDLLKENPGSFLYAYLAGGMVFYGGLFGVITFSFYVAKWFNIDIRDYYSSLIPGYVLFAGFGRIGCFLTGCCYGAQTDSSHGMMFQLSQIAPHDVYLIPTQLYEAMFDFFLVLVIIAFNKILPQINLLKVYLYSYAVFRFVIEFYRGDDYRGSFLHLSTSQWISVFVVITLLFVGCINKSKKLTKAV